MRPSTLLVLLVVCLSLCSGSFYSVVTKARLEQEEKFISLKMVVSGLALSDLALSTEARYTRHPAVSDSVVVSMDHPGAIDHFPSTLFWAPIR